MKTKEIPVCGMAAVQALFDREPASIRRLFFDLETSRRVAKIASFLAQQKRVYRVLPEEELQKVAGTIHHGGIVAIIAAKPLEHVTTAQLQTWAAESAPILILDRIGNAHNLGAIARSAAFFGVKHMILPDHPEQAVPSEASYRVAEGGMEYLQLFTVGNLPSFCRALAKYYDVLGTSVARDARPIGKWMASRPRSAVRPIALVLGNEEHGLAPEVGAACTGLVHLPAAGAAVESLNVSVAAGILIWEIWGRQRTS